jgi:conjugal transfer pilus assembly protein TraE
MLRSIWKENLYALFKQRNWAIAFAVGMMITNVFLGVKVFRKEEKVIVVPAYLKQSFWVEGESVSKEYLEEMTLFFANLLLNVSPESMQYQRDVALKYVSPEFHNTLYQRLIEEEEQLRKQSLSTTFRAKEVKVNLDKGEATVKGILTQYVGDKKAGQAEEIYKATYGYTSGILTLNGFEVEDEQN